MKWDIKMPNRRFLMVRLTKDQYERIRVNASAKGFKTVSQYVRSSIFEHDSVFERKFEEIYQKVVSDTNGKQNIKERPFKLVVDT